MDKEMDINKILDNLDDIESSVRIIRILIDRIK